jgi:hypothetical protein
MKSLWKKFVRWLAKDEIAEEVRKRKDLVIQRDKLKQKLRALTPENK